MKLIFCPKCQDVLKLSLDKKNCKCGESWGRYKDKLNAVIGGEAVPLGFDNGSFVGALRGENLWNQFTAFVIDLPCKTIKKEEKENG